MKKPTLPPDVAAALNFEGGEAALGAFDRWSWRAYTHGRKLEVFICYYPKGGTWMGWNEHGVNKPLKPKAWVVQIGPPTAGPDKCHCVLTTRHNMLVDIVAGLLAAENHSS